MQNREKKLLLGLIGVTLVGLTARFVYPALIRPMFDYGAEIAKIDQEIAELEEDGDLLELRLRDKYKSYVLRSGGVDPKQAQDELYECLSAVCREVKLGGKVAPKALSTDRRSNIASLRISVSATGTFSQCIEFVTRFYRIPYIVRLNSLTLDPTPSRGRTDHDEVKLDAEIEALFVPQAKDWGVPTGPQPKEIERITTANIEHLRAWRPFTPYVEPTVVREPIVEKDPDVPAPPEPTPPVTEPTWPDAQELMIKMVNSYGSGDYWVREVLLQNVMDASERNVAVGETLDGGELVLAHALGVVVHKTNGEKDFGYWVYPLGELLNARLRLEESARQWPEIYVAMRQHLELHDAAAAARLIGAVQQNSPPSMTIGALRADAGGTIEVEMTDEEIDQVLREAAEMLATEVASDVRADDMGPPLPTAMSAAADINTTGADDKNVNLRGAPAPRRTSPPAVQGADGERPPRSHRAARSGARAGSRSGPAGTAPRNITNQKESPNEENDDVAPPE